MNTKRKAIIVLAIFVVSFTVSLIDALGDTKVSRCKRCSEVKRIATKNQPCSFEYNGVVYNGTYADDLEGRTCDWAFTLSTCTSHSVRGDCVNSNLFSGRPVVAYVCVE